jgi:hypothetical protein
MAILHPREGGTQALETACIWLLTAFRPQGMIYVSGATMNLRQITLAVVLTAISGAAALAQEPLIDPRNAPSAKDTPRAEAYYNSTMGHIYE